MTRERTEYIDVRDVAQSACYEYDLDPGICRAAYRSPQDNRSEYGFLLLTEEVEGSYKETYRVEGVEFRDLLERQIMNPDKWRVKEAFREGYRPGRNPYHPDSRLAQKFEQNRYENPSPPQNPINKDTIRINSEGESQTNDVEKPDLGTIEVVLRPKYPEEKEDFTLEEEGGGLSEGDEETIDNMLMELEGDQEVQEVEKGGPIQKSKAKRLRSAASHSALVGFFFLLFVFLVPPNAVRIVAAVTVMAHAGFTYFRADQYEE